MSISVKGDQIRLLDLSMIRRYGTPTPIVDPAVASILIKKGFAMYINKIEENKEQIEEIKEDEKTIFPKEIIGV